MQVLLLGRKSACANVLDHIIAQGHEIVGVVTDSHLEGSPTAARAKATGVRLMTHSEVDELVGNGTISFDVGLSVVYWRKIPESWIRNAPRGIINFHPAPLPEYKGTGGYNLAILEGLDNWAVTAHYMDRQIDTGRIIEVDWFQIDLNHETAVSLEATSMNRIERLAKDIVNRVARTEAELPTTPNVGGRYISRAEMESMKVVAPGDNVERKIRAFWFPPYSGATVEIDGQEFTLVSEKILEKLATGEATSLHSAAPDVGSK